ncbi:MAG: hypothetical protein ACKVPJ_01980 [Chitinophagales bacterium]
MIASKPYVYLDESGNTKKVSVYIKCGDFNIASTTSQTVQNNTLIVVCTITSAGSGTVGPKIRELRNDVSYTKVRVETKVSGTLVGSTTVKVNSGHFSENPYKPHVYIHTPTASSEIYSVVNTSTGYSLSATDKLLDQVNHKVTFFLDETAGTGGFFDWSDDNPDASTYNLVEVQIRNSAKTITKGKGTTDQNDADSSGDE